MLLKGAALFKELRKWLMQKMRPLRPLALSDPSTGELFTRFVLDRFDRESLFSPLTLSDQGGADSSHSGQRTGRE